MFRRICFVTLLSLLALAEASTQVARDQSSDAKDGQRRAPLTAVNDRRLAELLALGSFREPDSAPGERSRRPSVRLWAVEREGSCVSGTHFVCSHEYYITLVNGDLGVDPPLYSLGTLGEISEFRWLVNRDPWVLELKILAYPVESARAQASLVQTSRILQLNVTLEEITVRP